MLTLGINASFLRKPDTGIGQVTINFLRELGQYKAGQASFNEKWRIILYLEEELTEGGMSLDNFQKRVFLPRFYRRDDLIRKLIWEKYLLPQKAEKDGCDVFLSLYQAPTTFKKGRVKSFMLTHDIVWQRFPQYLNNFRKRIYYRQIEKGIQQADKLITVSQLSKREIAKLMKIPLEKISENYIDCDPIFKNKITEEAKAEILEKYQLKNQNYIFYVGGFDVRKNVDRLIEAYGIFYRMLKVAGKKRKEIPILVLAGKFYPHLVPLVTDLPKEIEWISEKYGMPKDKVKLLGFVEQADLPGLYAAANFFCYPSLYEGFGLPPLEAQNCDCPVIASRKTSLREILDQESALLINPYDPAALASAMRQLWENDNLKERLKKAGRENSQRFNWEAFTGNILRLLEEAA